MISSQSTGVIVRSAVRELLADGRPRAVLPILIGPWEAERPALWSVDEAPAMPARSERGGCRRSIDRWIGLAA